MFKIIVIITIYLTRPRVCNQYKFCDNIIFHIILCVNIKFKNIFFVHAQKKKSTCITAAHCLLYLYSLIIFYFLNLNTLSFYIKRYIFNGLIINNCTFYHFIFKPLNVSVEIVLYSVRAISYQSLH